MLDDSFSAAPNRKTLLPPADTLAPDDPRQWAILFTRARRRHGWTYDHLAARAGTTPRTTIRACTVGHCHTATFCKLAVALGLVVTLPATRP